MRRLGWLLLGLALLLGWLQYRLWLGDGSWGEVTALQNQVAHQRRDNAGLQQRNDALAAEVEDLKSGEAAVEERARLDAGPAPEGRLPARRLLAQIEFAHAVVIFCRHTSASQLEETHFRTWLATEYSQYPALSRFLGIDVPRRRPAEATAERPAEPVAA